MGSSLSSQVVRKNKDNPTNQESKTETCGAPDGICIGAKFTVDMRSGCKWV